ncbi:non-ribosomal peptide synthetase, partial [Photobacterium galatheae]|uniref:non-ribosomal peptide synthetase n=1 Tax=Photobacterium galatheae TaxID=1654360 RepID=UPI00126887F9
QQSAWEGGNDVTPLLTHPVNLAKIRQIDRPAAQTLTLAGADYQQIKHTCQQFGVTLNVMLQFAWHKLLHTYTGDSQTLVGTTVSGRDVPVEGIEQSVGLYINTLPLCVDWSPLSSVSDILQKIHQQVAAINTHSAMSLAKLQQGGERLFHSLMVFENYPAPVADGQKDDSIANHLVFREAIEKVDYPLSVMGYEQDQTLVVKLSYGLDWLDDAQAQRLLQQVQAILLAVARDPHQHHDAITLLSMEEKHTLLTTFNQTEAPYPQDRSLAALFEAQVARTPDNIALVFEGQSLTYRELNSRANQLARQIRQTYRTSHQAELPADTLVALYLDRSPEMVVSILAVLKAGAAYVPVSPDYPVERSAFILEDTRAPLVITHAPQRASVDALLSGGHDTRMILADSEALTELPDSNLDSGPSPEDLAYVIYTSGTTGQPKGVMVAHQSAGNTLQSMKAVYDFDLSGSRVSCFSQYTFDVSVSEMLNSLLFGGELHLLGESYRRDPHLLSAYIDAQALNILYVPPVVLAALPQKQHATLKTILFAGESCDPEACLHWHQHYALYNFYGPTETSIYAAGKLTERRNLNEIGKPINNTQLYVLDDNQQLLPLGAVGELYIGGAGLARGYLNRPVLTAERFIDNPFATDADKAKGYTRLYRTGDLVRWLPDGNLEYL